MLNIAARIDQLPMTPDVKEGLAVNRDRVDV